MRLFSLVMAGGEYTFYVDELVTRIPGINIPLRLRTEQKDALSSLLNFKHTCVFLPTGFGKSMIFMLYPLILCETLGGRNIALVVSPLKSLMKNLEAEYRGKGFPVIHVQERAMMDSKEITALEEGQYPIVLVTPEALESGWRKVFLDSDIYRNGVSLVAIDEAHTAVEWSGFRRSYEKIGDLRAYFDCPFLLTTATVNKDMLASMLSVFHLRREDVQIVCKKTDRANIFLEYISDNCEDPAVILKDYISELKSKGTEARKAVIYTRHYSHLGHIYMTLMENLGPKAFKDEEATIDKQMIAMFHAEVSELDQQRILDMFTRPKSIIRCVIVSVAFGMGVNIPDIELIYHWGEPESPLAYWQKVGRGGRDGRPCRGILCHNSTCLRLITNPEKKAAFQRIREDQNVCIRQVFLEQCHIEDMGDLADSPVSCKKNREVYFMQMSVMHVLFLLPGSRQVL